MRFLQFPINHECGFWVTALLFSAYFAVRAIFTQMELRASVPCKCKMFFMWVLWDMNFNFVGSMAGWCALYMISRYVDQIEKFNTTGGGIIFAFLVFLSIAGISGMVPQLLVQGKIPGLK